MPGVGAETCWREIQATKDSRRFDQRLIDNLAIRHYPQDRPTGGCENATTHHGHQQRSPIGCETQIERPTVPLRIESHKRNAFTFRRDLMNWEIGLCPDEQLTDSATFRDESFYTLLAKMRREHPVHWTTGHNSAHFWSVFKHADVKWVMHEGALFSSEVDGIMPLMDEALRDLIVRRRRVARDKVRRKSTAHIVLSENSGQPALPHDDRDLKSIRCHFREHLFQRHFNVYQIGLRHIALADCDRPMRTGCDVERTDDADDIAAIGHGQMVNAVLAHQEISIADWRRDSYGKREWCHRTGKRRFLYHDCAFESSVALRIVGNPCCL